MEVPDEMLDLGDAIGELDPERVESMIRDGARVEGRVRYKGYYFGEEKTVTPLELAFCKMEEHARYEYLDGFILDRVILRVLSITSFSSSIYLSGKNS